jgi:uncharacterized membrane protein
MQIENNKTLTSLVIAFLAVMIIESLFGLLSSYIVAPMLQTKSGFDGVSGYYKIQGFIYAFLNIVNFILLLLIGIQVKNAVIRALVFVYAVLQLGWALYPLFNLLRGQL